MKNQKGITLIALIITIIVMLILVGVSVTVALNGGLFSTAQKATGDTKAERDNELALSDGKVTINGEEYNSIDEYVKGDVAGEETGKKLAAGLYDENDVLMKDWSTLMNENILYIDPEPGIGGLQCNDRSVLTGKLIIDESVTSIASGAFNGSNLISVEIPDSVTNMAAGVFHGCSNLSTVVIPNTIPSLNVGVFGYCANLRTINYTGTKEEWNAIEFVDPWNADCSQITVHCTDGDIIIPAYGS